MPAPNTFWQDRAARHGHTGWGDQVLYAYDQLERIEFVTKLLERLDLAPMQSVAVDFGCGTGDFSRLLLERGCTVYGYDPFVEPDLVHPRFTYLGDGAAFAAAASSVDLVLSVTVLDHILDEGELAESLAIMRRALRPGGCLLLLEYALADDAAAVSRNDYQAFRTMRRWREHFAAAGYDLVEHGPVPHPVESPSEGFLRYRRKLLVRAAGRIRLAQRRLPQRVLRRVARRSLGATPPCFPHRKPSPLQFMVCRKR